MTRWIHPAQRDRAAQREAFDPIIEGARYGLSRDLALSLWQLACAGATDATGRHDVDLARLRFHDLAARGGRPGPDPGRVTRVGVEVDGTCALPDALAVGAPGRDTLVAARARRWAQLDSEPAADAAGGVLAEPLLAEGGLSGRGADLAVSTLPSTLPVEQGRLPVPVPVIARSARAMDRAVRLFGGAAGARPPGNGVAIRFGGISSNAPLTGHTPTTIGRPPSRAPDRGALAALGLGDVIAAIEALPRRRALADAVVAATTRAARPQARALGTPAGLPDLVGHTMLHVAARCGATLYRRATEEGQVREDDPAIAEALARVREGEALPATIKHEMEQALGVSLAGVRVHVDDIAAKATRAVAARAFTVGEDIFFARGAFAPGTQEGNKLLAHELAHVVQAYEGRTRTAADSLQVSRPSDALEREAEAVADRVTSWSPHARQRRTLLRSGAPVRSRSLLRAAAPDGVAMLDGVVDHLIELWEREKVLEPSRAAEFDGNIARLRARERPSARQSEAEMIEIHRWVGGQGERGFKHGRAAPRGGSGSKGSTKPDVNLSSVMIEVKNYNIHSKPLVRNLLKELERQIGERRAMGPYDIKYQSVIIDVRGQRATPGELAALRTQIAQRTGLAEEHVQFTQWLTDSEPAMAKAAAAGSTASGSSTKSAAGSSASSALKPAEAMSAASDAKLAGTSAPGASGSAATPSGPRISVTSAKAAPASESLAATPAASTKTAARRTPAPEPLAPPRPALPTVTPSGGGRVSQLLGRFGEILTVVFSAKVQVPLAIVTEMLAVLDATNMATGALSGEGFVLQAEIARAEEISRASQALLAWYSQQHEALLAAVTEANALILAKGARETREEMRRHAAALIPALRGRSGEVGQLSGFAAAGRDEANQKIQLALALFDSSDLTMLAVSAGMGSAAKAKLVGVREDLYRVRSRLATTCETLAKVQSLLEEDVEILSFYR